MGHNMPTKRERLTEYVISEGHSVDREAGVIKGVKLCGLKSKNGRSYSAKALREALDKYNRSVSFNHPPKNDPTGPRGIGEMAGRIVNARMTDGGPVGDFEVLKSTSHANMIFEAAERMPEVFGFSHVADCAIDKKTRTVETIDSIVSLDVVTKPATTQSLFESHDMDTKRKVRDILTEQFTKPEQVKLLKVWEEEMPVVMDAPVDEPTGDTASDSDAQIKAAFRAMVMAAFDDESLDTKATVQRIKDILAAQEKLTGARKAKQKGGMDMTDEEKAEKEKAAAEQHQVKVADETKLLREEMTCRDAVEDAGLKFAKPEARRAFVKAMIPMDEEARDAMIADRKTLMEQIDKAANPPAPEKPKGPRSQGPSTRTTTTVSEQHKVPELKDREALKRFIFE